MGCARWAAFAALGLALPAAAAPTEPSVRFDTLDVRGGAPVSLFESVREATKDMELPAAAKTRDVTPSQGRAVESAAAAKLPAGVSLDPAFWGSDGRWCEDGRAYHGGPCDWGDPYYRDPYYRDPYYRDPYYRDPYYRDPYYRHRPHDPHRRDPHYRGDPHRRGPGQGPTREPWRDPPTRRR